MVKVLIIGDEKKIASFLRTGLEARGFVVTHDQRSLDVFDRTCEMKDELLRGG